MAWKPDPKWLPDSTLTSPSGRATPEIPASSGVDVLDTKPLAEMGRLAWQPDTTVVEQWRKNNQGPALGNRVRESKPVREPKPKREWPKREWPKREWRKPSRTVLAVGAVLGVFSIAAIATGVYGLSDGPGGVAPAVPTAAAMPAPVIASIPAFCPDSSKGPSTTTSGPGTDATAAGVIAALDYAYYSKRDAGKVTALMVSAPSTVAAIQAAIDSVPAGTKACVSTAPDTAPGVWLVDVQLHAPTGRDTWLHQRITVAAQDSPNGLRFKIARIEDRQTP